MTGRTASGCAVEERLRARRAARRPTARCRAGRRPRPAARPATCTVAPRGRRRGRRRRRTRRPSPASPAKSSPSASASRGAPAGARHRAAVRDHGSSGSGPASTASTAAASATSRANTLTQSSERQAGTHAGRADQPAGRLEPDDAVDRGRHPAGARGVGAEREGDHARRRRRPRCPSSTRRRSDRRRTTLSGAPYGERVPVRPVANWSRLVLPTSDRAGGEQPGDARARPRPGV